MSSPNHPTSDIEDAFSLNFHDYFPATSRNNSPNSSDDFTKYLLAILVFSPLHDMEVMPAYDATNNKLPIPLIQTIIALPNALPPSSVSPMFDSQNFFPPKEISPKDTKTSKSPTSVSPSSSIGSSSLVRMHPKRTSTSAASAMTQAAIKKLVDDSVFAALEAPATNMENINNTTGPRETPIARKCMIEIVEIEESEYLGRTCEQLGRKWQEKGVHSYSGLNSGDGGKGFGTSAIMVLGVRWDW
nr:hypothetical protein [Tanacetum cinerariifolium]